ncbi:MAG: hypothetical protein QF492_00140 [Candidatus Krumholzibacteria bacterium]|jgi:hypothetical protein|nr:hypothetical protein [Candidatus Krumholzibacteria bacterium]
MKRRTLAILAVAVLLPASLYAEEVCYSLFEEGYSFTDSIEVDGEFSALGFLTPDQPENPPLELDFDSYEVTWVVMGMRITSKEGTAFSRRYEIVGGSVDMLQDESFDFQYGSSPEQGLETAENGVSILSGQVLEGTLIHSEVMGIGTFLGNCLFTDGSRRADLGPLADLEWTLQFTINSSDALDLPDGYHSRWVGKIFARDDTAVEGSSWSVLKALY